MIETMIAGALLGGSFGLVVRVTWMMIRLLSNVSKPESEAVSAVREAERIVNERVGLPHDR